MEATVGMYDELKSVAGKALGEIEGLGMGKEEPSLLACRLNGRPLSHPYKRPLRRVGTRTFFQLTCHP